MTLEDSTAILQTACGCSKGLPTTPTSMPRGAPSDEKTRKPRVGIPFTYYCLRGLPWEQVNHQAKYPDRRLCSSPTPSARGRTQPSLNRHGISKDDKDPGLRMCFFLCV